MSAYVLMVDDHPLYRAALRVAVTKAAPEAEVIEAGSLAEAREAVAARGRPLLALLDLKLPDSEGYAGVVEMRALLDGAPLAVVSGDETPGVAAAVVRLGAAGFIAKASQLPTMIEAIEALTAGLTWTPDLPDQEASDEMMERIASLTLAQQRVLVGLQKGLLNKQIAYDSGITEATVKAHMTAIFRKLGVQSRTQAVLAARRVLAAQDAA